MSQDIHEFSGEPFEISNLMWKYLQQDIAAEEQAALDAWVGRSEANKRWFHELTESKALQARLSSFYAITVAREEARSKLLLELRPGKTARMKWIMLAAASVLLIASLVVFTWNRGGENEQAVVSEINAPASNKAILSFDDGRTIYLDSARNGLLLSQNNVQIEKLADGQLVYRQQAGAQALIYNTLSNPRGSRVIDITLADGSRVWLNNESSVRFPLAFGPGERRVTITGEAYFEVAKDATRKFVVESDGSTTEVLGTQFNVNAYPDNNTTTTTLVEGSVRVKKGAAQLLLSAGQQSTINGDVIQRVTNADVENAVAWKNGLIIFDHTGIGAIFKQIERWYDVEVVVNRPLHVPEMTGGLPRTMSLGEVLNVLEINSQLSFKIEGKKVIVLP